MFKKIIYILLNLFCIESFAQQSEEIKLNDKIGQSLMISVNCKCNNEYKETLKNIVKEIHPGCIFLKGGSLKEQNEIIQLCQNNSSIPPLFATDWNPAAYDVQIPPLLAVASVREDSLIFTQPLPFSNFQNDIIYRSLIYQYGKRLADSLRKRDINMIVLPFVNDSSTLSFEESLFSLGNKSSRMYAQMTQFFSGLISGNIIPSLKLEKGTPNFPSNIQTYIKTLLNYDCPIYIDMTHLIDTTETLHISPNGYFLCTPENAKNVVRYLNLSISQKILTEKSITDNYNALVEKKNKKEIAQTSTPKDSLFYHRIFRHSVTVIKNDKDILPLKRLDTLNIASVNLGVDSVNSFQKRLSSYMQITHFAVKETAVDNLTEQLSPYNCIIIYNSLKNEKTLNRFISALNGKHIILYHKEAPTRLSNTVQLPVNAILLGYGDNVLMQEYAAQAIFGGIAADAILPISINLSYPSDISIRTPQTRLGYTIPEFHGTSPARLLPIDSICNAAIAKKAMPGCQVLIVKNNDIIFNKAYGFHTYAKKQPNTTQDIYDLASVTKISATLPAFMKIYGERHLSLDSTLADYCPRFRNTNKAGITMYELLLHNARLAGSINVFVNSINRRSIPGSLYTVNKTRYNTYRVKRQLYMNPNFTFKSHTLSRTPKTGYELLTPGMYVYPSYRDSIEKMIVKSKLRQKSEYFYSDLSFICLQYVVEDICGQKIDEYCKKEIYNHLGAYHTDYIAYERLKDFNIIPSSFDKLYRKQELKGSVHDPLAATMGGIAGNAGLFSSAEDLAKIMSLYLNDGEYGEERFFAPGNAYRFTLQCEKFPQNKRALGFDKPDADSRKTCTLTPESCFGHTGFTGTSAWCDPDNNLIYIFLSNRTYPEEQNMKIQELNIRAKVQEIIYRAFEKSCTN